MVWSRSMLLFTVQSGIYYVRSVSLYNLPFLQLYALLY